MFWKKRKDQPKEISPSTYQKEDRIAEAILGLKYTVADNADADRKQERREDIGNKLLQVATLLFVILTTVGIFYQASILNSSDKSTHESAKAAKDAADAAKTAAEAATVSNRAWVAPRVIFIDTIDPPDNIKVKVFYENTGKTPALDVSFHSEGKFLSQLDGSVVPEDRYRNVRMGENESCEIPAISFAGVAYPSSPQVQSGSFFTLSLINLVQLTKDVKVILIIRGCFKYRSEANWHKSTFCSYLEPNQSLPIEKWAFKDCADGADAD